MLQKDNVHDCVPDHFKDLLQTPGIDRLCHGKEHGVLIFEVKEFLKGGCQSQSFSQTQITQLVEHLTRESGNRGQGLKNICHISSILNVAQYR